jgi:hypothetical protein
MSSPFPSIFSYTSFPSAYYGMCVCNGSSGIFFASLRMIDFVQLSSANSGIPRRNRSPVRAVGYWLDLSMGAYEAMVTGDGTYQVYITWVDIAKVR